MSSEHTKMDKSSRVDTRKCRWIDLAAIDAPRAVTFYTHMFGWSARSVRVDGGEFVEFAANGKALASVYQLTATQIQRGVPQHWTPYIGVGDIHDATAKAAELGGEVIVAPFSLDGAARVTLIADSGGALLGLWESPQ